MKIAVFTGTRAEYGLMKTLIKKLDGDEYFDLNLIVSSTHLDQKFGRTIQEINSDGIKPDCLIPISIQSLKKYNMSFQTAETIKGVSKALEKFNSDFLLVLGDRYETFGAAIAANLMGVKVIHLHGGETTLGALDNNFRHAITQLSEVHFTSAEKHSQKVKKMVGSNKYVFDVGPMAIDGILNLKSITKNEFEKKTGFIFGKTNFLLTYHSVTLSKDLGLTGLINLVEILEDLDCNLLFTNPNADVGSEKIKSIISNFVNKDIKKRFLISSLGHELYLNALILFDCVIGNSSSGIIEAPLIGTRVLNIGDRQKGRYRFGEVKDVSINKKTLLKNIQNIILNSRKKIDEDLKSKNDLSKHISPSDKIIEILKDLEVL